MNVLVTGGAGYIGSHTCVELLEQGYGVVVVDNLCNSNSESLRRVEQLTGKRLQFYEADVRDEAAMTKIFAENAIDCVIHFAGLKAVGESVAMPLAYYDNNLNSTLVLTKVMGKAGVKNLIFSSSATVYTANQPMPLREDSITGNCTNPYGWTKYMTEQILQGVAHAHRLAVQTDLAGGGREGTGQHVHQRGFASAVFTKQTDDLAGMYCKIHMVDCAEGAEVHDNLFHFGEQRMFLLFCSG